MRRVSAGSNCAPSRLRPMWLQPKLPKSRWAIRSRFSARTVGSFDGPSSPSAYSNRPSRSAFPRAPRSCSRKKPCFRKTLASVLPFAARVDRAQAQRTLRRRLHRSAGQVGQPRRGQLHLPVQPLQSFGRGEAEQRSQKRISTLPSFLARNQSQSSSRLRTLPEKATLSSGGACAPAGTVTRGRRRTPIRAGKCFSIAVQDERAGRVSSWYSCLSGWDCSRPPG